MNQTTSSPLTAEQRLALRPLVGKLLSVHLVYWGLLNEMEKVIGSEINEADLCLNDVCATLRDPDTIMAQDVDQVIKSIEEQRT